MLVGGLDGLQFLLNNGADINSAFTYQSTYRNFDDEDDYVIFHICSDDHWKRFDPEPWLKGEF